MIDTVFSFARLVLSRLLTIVAESDFISLSVALGVFWYVGHSAVRSQPDHRRAGLQLGVVGFLGYVFWQGTTIGIHSGNDLASAAVRALYFGGFVTSAAFLIASAVASLWSSFGSAGDILAPRERRR